MTKALAALAALLAVSCAVGTATLASEAWGEIVVSAQDIITHE
jgi:hypothetical protein